MSQSVPNILEKIAAYKRDEVAALKSRTSLEALREQAADISAPKAFEAAIRARNPEIPGLIAEIKKASPSKGLIRADFDPEDIAQAYATGGAACLSVLTDSPGFQGSREIFTSVRATSKLPMLRKDFMLEPIQIAESRVMGADAILVILAMIDDDAANALMEEADNLGMEALVETHDEVEITRAIKLGARLIGINNRDLRTFETSLETFVKLAPQVPDRCTLIAESGIFTPNDVAKLQNAGAHGLLVGESLMRQSDVAKATKSLLQR